VFGVGTIDEIVAAMEEHYLGRGRRHVRGGVLAN
jgi:hypothetical protein